MAYCNGPFFKHYTRACANAIEEETHIVKVLNPSLMSKGQHATLRKAIRTGVAPSNLGTPGVLFFGLSGLYANNIHLHQWGNSEYVVRGIPPHLLPNAERMKTFIEPYASLVRGTVTVGATNWTSFGGDPTYYTLHIKGDPNIIGYMPFKKRMYEGLVESGLWSLSTSEQMIQFIKDGHRLQVVWDGTNALLGGSGWDGRNYKFSIEGA